MKRIYWATAIVAIVILVGLAVLLRDSGESAPSASRASSFDIGMVTFPGYAPLYLAKEKGFFGGLEVNLRRIEDIGSIRAGVASKDLEGYLATLDIALDINSEPPGVAFWAIDESAGGDGVVVSQGISSLADLKGRTLAAEPGFPPYFILLYLLNEQGLGLSDVAFRDMTTQDAASAFSGGAVDAAGIYEPYLSEAVSTRSGSRVVISSADTPGLIVDLIFARRDVLERRPDDIQTIIAGWNKALDYIAASPKEANEIMARAFGLPVAEFVDIASSVRWLGTQDNKSLFGTPAARGTLYSNFAVVLKVLSRNRDSVFQATVENKLDDSFVRELPAD